MFELLIPGKEEEERKRRKRRGGKTNINYRTNGEKKNKDERNYVFNLI